MILSGSLSTPAVFGSEVGAAASYPPSPSSSAKDRWAMESPWQGTTPGTWAAGYKAEEGADRSAMPASVVVPTADFEPRSIKELQRAIKEAAAARQVSARTAPFIAPHDSCIN